MGEILIEIRKKKEEDVEEEAEEEKVDFDKKK